MHATNRFALFSALCLVPCLVPGPAFSQTANLTGTVKEVLYQSPQVRFFLEAEVPKRWECRAGDRAANNGTPDKVDEAGWNKTRRQTKVMETGMKGARVSIDGASSSAGLITVSKITLLKNNTVLPDPVARGPRVPFVCSPSEPEQSITNGPLQAKIYLPNSQDGYYKGTRFDWSGVISSLTFQGHNYYGPWFQERRAGTRDFVYEGNKVVTGTASSITGPVEEYAPQGYDEAAPGGVFIKLGIGALRKPDATAYDHYKDYAFVEPGKWTVTSGPNFVTFRHDLTAPNGIAYVYTKTVRLAPDQPKMVIEHSLRNTGQLAIKTSGYNHNFVSIDGKPAGPGYTISTPFDIKTPKPLEGNLATITGKQLAYQKQLQGEDRVTTPMQGFGNTASDYDFRLESKEAGAGIRFTGDKPLSRAMMWSIRTVVSVEPFIDINVEPGKEMTWNYNYEFYTLPK